MNKEYNELSQACIWNLILNPTVLSRVIIQDIITFLHILYNCELFKTNATPAACHHQPIRKQLFLYSQCF
jgi:hypothetical protein